MTKYAKSKVYKNANNLKDQKYRNIKNCKIKASKLNA